MNDQKIPKPPTLLLLLLLAASCGLLLLHTLTNNIQNGGLHEIQNAHAKSQGAYEMIP